MRLVVRASFVAFAPGTNVEIAIHIARFAAKDLVATAALTAILSIPDSTFPTKAIVHELDFADLAFSRAVRTQC